MTLTTRTNNPVESKGISAEQATISLAKKIFLEVKDLLAARNGYSSYPDLDKIKEAIAIIRKSGDDALLFEVAECCRQTTDMEQKAYYLYKEISKTSPIYAKMLETRWEEFGSFATHNWRYKMRYGFTTAYCDTLEIRQTSSGIQMSLRNDEGYYQGALSFFTEEERNQWGLQSTYKKHYGSVLTIITSDKVRLAKFLFIIDKITGLSLSMKKKICAVLDLRQVLEPEKFQQEMLQLIKNGDLEQAFSRVETMIDREIKWEMALVCDRENLLTAALRFYQSIPSDNHHFKKANENAAHIIMRIRDKKRLTEPSLSLDESETDNAESKDDEQLFGEQLQCLFNADQSPETQRLIDLSIHQFCFNEFKHDPTLTNIRNDASTILQMAKQIKALHAALSHYKAITPKPSTSQQAPKGSSALWQPADAVAATVENTMTIGESKNVKSPRATKS